MSGIHGGRAWSGWPEKQAALAAASLVASLAKAAALLLLVTYFCAAGMPQDEAPASGARVFTLKEAVNFALANYPAVKAAEEQIAAAQGGVALARTGYLPRVDALWQSNRATRNNVFGLLLPQSVISPISGPVLTSTSMGSVWGSAGGVLFSWEPLDFGYRHATVKAAQAAESQASAEAGLTRLGVAAKAAAAFLNLLAAGQRVRSAQADVERREVFGRSVRVLVNNQLRPGAEASRADAELAAARTRLIEAQSAEQAGRAGLAAALGIAGTEVRATAGSLLDLPLGDAPAAPAPVAHPLVAVEKAKLEENSARLRAVERSYVPRFNLESTVYGRGSGAKVDGSLSGGLNGLGLERANWAAGLTVTFPLAEIASLRARRQTAAASERAEEARYKQVVQDLTGESQAARALLEGARRVAKNTPIGLKAARDTESQARARFQAGLANVVEVAEAQRLLVQAETEDALARLNVWHALEAVAVAEGDLGSFLGLVR